MNTAAIISFRYPYEEFADHIRAMRTVSEWEYTSRFGHVGNSQSSRARSARVLDYFSDSYSDQNEAIHKAGVFLSVHDYVGRHLELFSRKGLVEEGDGGVHLVEPNLLRAVHHLFTASPQAGSVPPKKILNLAKAFREVAEG